MKIMMEYRRRESSLLVCVAHELHLEKYQLEKLGRQIAAFLILEFGVIFHSVIIGLNFGAPNAAPSKSSSSFTNLSKA